MAEFFLLNEAVESDLKAVQKRIWLMRNGVVADRISASGARYASVWGVEFFRLRALAAEILENSAENSALARRLFATKNREQMLLAALLMPANELSENEAEKWLKEETEVVEVACSRLFPKMKDAKTVCEKWILEGGERADFGFLTLRNLVENLTEAEKENFAKMAIEKILFSRGAVKFLQTALRENETVKILVKNWLEKNAENSKSWAFEELKTEVEFS